MKIDYCSHKPFLTKPEVKRNVKWMIQDVHGTLRGLKVEVENLSQKADYNFEQVGIVYVSAEGFRRKMFFFTHDISMRKNDRID